MTEYNKITLPEGLKYIGKAAFMNIKNLAEINLPSSLVRIEEQSFYWSYNADTIDFSACSSLEYIGSQAFAYTKATTV